MRFDCMKSYLTEKNGQQTYIYIYIRSKGKAAIPTINLIPPI